MTTIAEENRKALRQAVNVLCGLRETSEEPTSIVPINCEAMYEGLANLDPGMLPATIMDLGGEGFRNTGEAVPMKTETDSYRYGYISTEAAKDDGTFDNPPGLTISAATAWENITLELRGQYGETRTMMVTPIWSGGQTTIYIDEWLPGERVYINGVFLGKAWIWDNSNIISANLDLHGVGTEIGGELEVSSIDIQAYEPTDYTDVIGRIPTGAPIWYAAGYDGDMSERRDFYLSEPISWDNNVLSVKGQDASMLLDEKMVATESNYTDYDVDTIIEARIRKALEDVAHEELGTAPELPMSTARDYVLWEAAARAVISQFMNVYNRADIIKPIYVDAGRPVLYWGGVPNRWTIYADEIAELDTLVEPNVNTIKATIEEYYDNYNESIATVKAVAGKTYFVEAENPIDGVQNVNITPTPASVELLGGTTIKFVAAATTTYTVAGFEVFTNLVNPYNPYTVRNKEKGIEYKFDEPMPIMDANIGSVTALSLAGLLERSNIVYEFQYRGNPHIQPRDVLDVEVVTWEDVQETVGGLYPATDLYPSASLYPSGEYEPARKMVRKWVEMTVDTVTLEHGEGGGLTSKIRARKGIV